MEDDNNIKHYTASDIEKYHKGELSPKEMHAMEKAALDDPFLADALEGYSLSGINVNADIAELRKRLTDKSQQAKVISMGAGRQHSFLWLRAVAMFVLIVGASLLAYQLFKPNKSPIIVDGSPVAKTEPKTGNATQLLTTQDTQSNYKITEELADKNVAPETQRKQEQDVATTNSIVSDKKAEVSPGRTSDDATITNPPVAANQAPKAEAKEFYNTNPSGQWKLSDTTKRADAGVVKNFDREALATQPGMNRSKNNQAVAGPSNATNQGFNSGYANNKVAGDIINQYRNINVFRGKITDLNNNALPFANITNTRDNVGTYSDAQGNFTLVSTDTVLNVQIKSLGFQNKNYSLLNSLADNKVMLSEDRNLPIDTVDKVKRNISRRRNNAMTLEEPEPEDGWDSYGSYVVNNLNVPDNFEMKSSGETADNTVEVSFDVNKNGEPVNIRVEKSLCDKCDKEAMRLIREGPKWKRKAKKSKRAIVTVPFIK